MKPVAVILSPEATEVYQKLVTEATTSKRAQSILKGIKDKTELIAITEWPPIGKKLHFGREQGAYFVYFCFGGSSLLL